jgi:hypothetical protein
MSTLPVEAVVAGIAYRGGQGWEWLPFVRIVIIIIAGNGRTGVPGLRVRFWQRRAVTRERATKVRQQENSFLQSPSLILGSVRPCNLWTVTAQARKAS